MELNPLGEAAPGWGSSPECWPTPLFSSTGLAVASVQGIRAQTHPRPGDERGSTEARWWGVGIPRSWEVVSGSCQVCGAWEPPGKSRHRLWISSQTANGFGYSLGNLISRKPCLTSERFQLTYKKLVTFKQEGAASAV